MARDDRQHGGQGGGLGGQHGGGRAGAPREADAPGGRFGVARWLGGLAPLRRASAIRRIGSLGATTLRLVSPPGRHPDPPLEEYTVRLAVRPALAGRFDLGHGRFEGAMAPGDFVVTQPGAVSDIELSPAAGEAVEALVLGLPAARVERLARARHVPLAAGLGALHDRVHADPGVAGLVAILRPEADNDALDDPLFVDSVIDAVVMRLLALAGAGTADSGAARSLSLSPQETARLVEAVEAALHRAVTTAEIAAAVGRPAGSLSAVFRATFGCTPRAFVQRRRLLRARALLAAGATPEAAAAACGFASPAHLAAAQRRPGAPRRGGGEA